MKSQLILMTLTSKGDTQAGMLTADQKLQTSYSQSNCKEKWIKTEYQAFLCVCILE